MTIRSYIWIWLAVLFLGLTFWPMYYYPEEYGRMHPDHVMFLLFLAPIIDPYEYQVDVPLLILQLSIPIGSILYLSFWKMRKP